MYIYSIPKLICIQNFDLSVGLELELAGCTAALANNQHSFKTLFHGGSFVINHTDYNQIKGCIWIPSG